MFLTANNAFEEGRCPGYEVDWTQCGDDACLDHYAEKQWVDQPSTPCTPRYGSAVDEDVNMDEAFCLRDDCSDEYGRTATLVDDGGDGPVGGGCRAIGSPIKKSLEDDLVRGFDVALHLVGVSFCSVGLI